MGSPAGERGWGLPTGYKINAVHSHPEWRGVQCLGDGGGDSVSGGSSVSLESSKGMACLEHGQI